MIADLDFSDEEHDPSALKLLLQITHLQFKDIPAKLSYDQLFNLAVLVEMYQARTGRMVVVGFHSFVQNNRTLTNLWRMLVYHGLREELKLSKD